MLKWYGKIYSTAIPHNYAGAIVFKIKKQTVVGFKAYKSLKEFADSHNGYFDNITQLWIIPVSDMKDIGRAIKSFEQNFPEISYLQIGCDGMPESVENSLKSWIEKRSANSPKPSESAKSAGGSLPGGSLCAASKVMDELRKAGIRCTRQDSEKVSRIFIDYQIKMSDEESIEINLSKGDIELIKSLGFKKDGALWELKV